MSRDDDPYLTGLAPPLRLMSLPGIAEGIAEDVRRAGHADHCEAAEEGLVARTLAGVELSVPLPLDENSQLDRRLVEDLQRHDRRVTDAEEHAARCRARRAELADALLRSAPCWTRARMCLTVAVYVLLALVAGVVVGAVLTPTLDSGFLSNYLPDKVDGDAGLLVMAVSFLASGGFVFLIAVLQLTVALATGGATGGARTAQLVALDVIFAAAWGLQRLASGGGYMAASVTLLELVAMTAYSLAVGALCGALRTNAVRATAYRAAQSSLHAASVAGVKAEAEREASERARLRLLQAVAPRDLAARSQAARRELVAETARAAYRVETGAVIEEAIANPTLERLNADLDRQLAARGESVAKVPASKGGLS